MNHFNNRQTTTKENLRVLYFTPYFTSSNIKIENYMTDQVNAVVKNFKNIEFLVYGTTNPTKNEVIRYKDRILLVNRTSYKSFLFLKDMIKIFTKFKPNIIYTCIILMLLQNNC